LANNVGELGSPDPVDLLDLTADLGGDFLGGVGRVVVNDNFDVNIGTHSSIFILRYD
jgi:hypothetical protein